MHFRLALAALAFLPFSSMIACGDSGDGSDGGGGDTGTDVDIVVQHEAGVLDAAPDVTTVTFWLAMDWVDGTDLATLLRDRGRPGLALPGATGLFPTGINANGAVVGWFTTDASAPYSQVTPDAPASGAFVRSSDGLITTFSSPGTLVSAHLGINAAGAVFGNYPLPASPTGSHGFVRSEEGIVSSFDPDRSSSTTATGINDSGVITGYYSDETGKVVSGFLRQPLETP